MRNVRILTLLILAMPALSLAEDGPPADRILSSYFLVDGASPGVESFPLKSTQVTANISGVIADVTVTHNKLRSEPVRPGQIAYTSSI